MLVTIMTDASLCGEQRVGGYGYWIASQRGKEAGGGVFKGTINDSYEAEFKAVANTLHTAIQKGLVLSGDRVIIQLDNSGVIHCMSGSNNVRKDIEPVYNLITQLRDQLNLVLEFRHVKGHSNRKEKRYIANNLCDMRAKKYMKQARKQHASNDK